MIMIVSLILFFSETQEKPICLWLSWRSVLVLGSCSQLYPSEFTIKLFLISAQSFYSSKLKEN